MRGFALCGIAFVNVPALWRLPFEAGRDNSVQEFFNLFVQQRFFPIFPCSSASGSGGCGPRHAPARWPVRRWP